MFGNKLHKLISRLFFTAFFVFVTFGTSLAQPKIIFRLDDYCIGKGAVQDSIVSLFIKNNIPLSVGVIPFESSTDTLKNTIDFKSQIELGLIEIAMHGFSHKENKSWKSMKNSFGKSEFAGDDYEIQYEKIKKGRDFLTEFFGVKPFVFSPPWNTYDKNTLKALKQAGFETVSSDLASKSYAYELNFLPFTVEDFDFISEENSEEFHLYNSKNVIVVMFHAYSIGTEMLPDIAALESKLNIIKKSAFDIMTFSQYLETNSAGAFRLYQNSRLHFNPILKKINKKSKYVYLNRVIEFYTYYVLNLVLIILSVVFIIINFRKLQNRS